MTNYIQCIAAYLIFKKLYELNEFKLLNIVELDTDEIIMLLSIVNLSG
jgi:hypothetical protein